MHDDHGNNSYIGKATIMDINNFVEILSENTIVSKYKRRSHGQ
jgi:hypothetical protein